MGLKHDMLIGRSEISKHEVNSLEIHFYFLREEANFAKLIKIYKILIYIVTELIFYKQIQYLIFLK